MKELSTVEIQTLRSSVNRQKLRNMDGLASSAASYDVGMVNAYHTDLQTCISLLRALQNCRKVTIE